MLRPWLPLRFAKLFIRPRLSQSVSAASSKPTASLLSLKGKERDKFVLKSMGITILFTAVLYLFVNYYWLQWLLAWASYGILKGAGYNVNWVLFDYNAYGIQESSYGLLQGLFDMWTSFESSVPFLNWNLGIAPAVEANYETRPVSYFTIVKACTAMQAGGLMIGLIVATPAENKQRAKAIFWLFISLFIGNALRIALIVGMTIFLVDQIGLSYDEGWMWAHDVLGKSISFLGTIIFTMIVEKQKVHILDTITVWMDTLLTKVGL